MFSSGVNIVSKTTDDQPDVLTTTATLTYRFISSLEITTSRLEKIGLQISLIEITLLWSYVPLLFGQPYFTLAVWPESGHLKYILNVSGLIKNSAFR